MTMTQAQLDERYRELNEEWFDYVYKETASMHSSREVFRETIQILKNNPNLQNSNKYFVDWFAFNYATTIALRIRKLVDQDRRAKSFVNLLKELKKTPKATSRSRWTAFGAGTVFTPAQIDQMYDNLVGKGRNFPDPAVIQQDIQLLIDESEKIKDYVDQRVAHYDRNLTAAIPTYKDVDDVFKHFEEILKKYYLLFRGGSLASALPTPQFNWMEIFNHPWIPANPEAF